MNRKKRKAMNRYIVKHTEKSLINKSPERIGGKASQLFNINPDLLPHWAVITADCPDDEISQVSEDIYTYLYWQNPNPSGLGDKLAVRSSAVGEDGKDQSFAGIFESKLNVPITGLELAVREVRDSAHTVKVHAYKQANYGFARPLPNSVTQNVAVIVMPMVLARYSGVLFSKEPVGGSDQMLVEWEEGVGGVVDGESNSNMIFLDSEDFFKSGTPIDKDGHPILLYEIWQEAKRLEKNYGRPVDIEWAINGEGKPYVLQVRPITAGVTV